jgi:hypothetical protein
MSWIVLSLVLSLSAAVVAEANRYFKMDGVRLSFWRTTVGASLLLPTVFIIDWPAPSLYYAGAMLAGVVMAVSTTIRMNLSSKKMGRVATLFMPVEAVVGFMLWFMVDAVFRTQMLNAPGKFAVILVCFALFTVSLAMMRRHDASWAAFITVAPLGVMHALNGIFGKYLLMENVAQAATAVILYVFIVQASAAVCSGCFLTTQITRRKPLCPPGMMRAAAVYGIAGLVGVLSFFAAVKAAPNPGYVVALAMLAPVWIMLWHKLRGMRDEGNPAAGLVMIFAAVLLVLVTV